MSKKKIVAVIGAAAVILTAGMAVVRIQAWIHSPEYQMERGMQYLEEQDYEKALAAFSRVAEADPQSAAAYERISEIHQTLQQTDQALDSLQAGFENTGKKSFAQKMVEMGEQYQQSDPLRADAIWDRVIALDAQLAEPYLLKAQARAENGDIEEAIAIVQAGQKKLPGEALEGSLQQLRRQRFEGWVADGKAALQREDFTTAQELFGHALQEQPEDAELYLLQASAMEQLQPQAAIALLEKGVSVTNDPRLQARIGELTLAQNLAQMQQLLAEDKLEEGAALAETILQLAPEHTEAFQMLVDKYLEREDKEQAMAVLQRWLELSENEQAKAQLEQLQEEERLRQQEELRQAALSREQSKRAIINSVALHPTSAPHSSAINSRIQSIFKSILTDGMDAYDKLKAGYDYIKRTLNGGTTNFSDANTVIISPADYLASEAWAEYGLRHNQGVCTQYAAIFYYMAKRLGFSPRLIRGTTPAAGGGNTMHHWVEIPMGDQVYVFDAYLDVNFGARGLAAPGAFFGTTYAEMPGRFNRGSTVR